MEATLETASTLEPTNGWKMSFLRRRKPEPVDRKAQRLGLSLVTTMRGESGQRGSILIRDLSESGFRAECLVKFHKGSDVVIDLPGSREVEATIEWTRRNMIGVSFKQPLAASYLLGAIGR